MWLDPRYFDHITPTPDGSKYRRYRLPPDWIGPSPDGRLRLDASRSGVIPQTADLPPTAEIASHDFNRGRDAFQAHAAAVESA